MSKEPVEGNSMSIPAAVEDEGEMHCLHECEIDNFMNQETQVGDQPEAEAEGIDFNEEVDSRKVHEFYFVKFWPYKDPEKDSKLEWADKVCEQLDQEKKLVIDEKMEEIMSRRGNINSQLLRKRYRSAVLECGVEWKTMVVDFLRAALDKLNVTGFTSSKQRAIHSPRILVTHGSNNLANEEQLLTKIPTGHQQKDINSSYLRSEIHRAYFWYSQSKNREKFVRILEDVKQIEERHEKAKADAAAKGNIWNPLSSKKAIEEQIKLLNKIPEELRSERCEVMAEIKCLENELKAVEKDENVLFEQFEGLIKRKSELCEFILSMRKEEDEANANYNEYLSLISKAKELARKKDVAALEELSRKQVDKWMWRWNDSQPFRMSYEKAILWSLHYRELSRDGRIRNDDEEQIIEIGDIHKQFLHLVSSFLALFIVLDERSKMQR